MPASIAVPFAIVNVDNALALLTLSASSVTLPLLVVMLALISSERAADRFTAPALVLATMAPFCVRSPVLFVSAVRLPTAAAPSVSALASTSETAPAFGIVTVPKSLVLPVSVKLPPPLSVRLLLAALKTPPESVLPLASEIVLSAVSVTVRLPSARVSVKASVPPPRLILPVPVPAAAAESVPALTVVVPL